MQIHFCIFYGSVVLLYLFRHGYTLMLNEAYNVLIQDDLRKKFDTSIGSMKAKFGCSASGFSSWHGPVRPQTLFVDANACIGCRECVHHASNTFEMDEALRCARVKVQYRDSDRKIDISVESPNALQTQSHLAASPTTNIQDPVIVDPTQFRPNTQPRPVRVST
ncbi:uncharacterized protein LOC120136523 [Hibiscus syriacus]|uniref:uncharacterized protein LOC120136523 n=1 Tax=Hibiscus syriacus TaxID=106335 RepID=UPI0019214C6F|nr:uncharacterized protein LOC120136523 [Hibiscus syriacus]